MEEKQAERARPNVVFLIADDHRFDGIGAYGNAVVQTPVLDRLAAEGVLFQSIYTMGGQTAALCVPCRASLLTGTNVFKATVSAGEVTLAQTENAKYWALNPEFAYLPEMFRKSGYRTFGTGKWHNGKESFARCFSDGASIFFGGMGEHVGLPVHDFDASSVYPDERATLSTTFSSELFAEAAIRFIGEQADGSKEPFFLYAAFTAPHDPRTPPPAYAGRYPAASIPLPDNFMREHPFDNGELTVRDEQLAATPRDPDEIRQHLSDYYSMISHLDEQIGRIMAALQASGHAENTIVVYTADHGLALGQHGLLGKQNIYEHSIHIPLIMSGPGLPQGFMKSGLGCQMDIFPTLCELAGVPVPAHVEGVNLLRGAGREHVFAAYKHIQRMVSDGRWKYIRYLRAGDIGTDRIQLFDLDSDPWETRDRSEEPEMQEHLRRLEQAMLAWQTRVKDPLAGIMNV
ncbi:sulfatase-like hydrolase/transferase [Paenibacillus oryzisoli]|uniref:sulfatase-like hydrolase/transferase n=1 Tax=Paenibacillus oryzisoli TaxID=1850517 RepID=UPI003D2E3AD4